MTLVTELTSRKADTSAPLIDALVERWSPRAYDPAAEISTDTLRTIFEAARWAPSANNVQPWRFIVARRGTAAFTKIHDALMGFNQAWADSAAVLVVNLAETSDDEGKQRPWARYDLGQAVAHMTVQAQHEGLHTHQMGGFDGARIHADFDLAENIEVVSITAIGALGDVDALPRCSASAKSRRACARGSPSSSSSASKSTRAPARL
ncbi:nitroreductase family protein [Agromyces protaetiae]|uniref:nitroreductase family protein n=1 Tax=Agromyces protaetiae TaxID=2509455 RepID=UPI0026C15269